MQKLADGEIADLVKRFVRGGVVEGERARDHGLNRQLSFDFAYNYFADTEDPTANMELSCLQLGYYLASWGMLRGSSYLFRHTNVAHYRHAIEVIAVRNGQMRLIDADSWDQPETQGALLDCYRQLRHALLPKNRSSLILVTKVMLGVWGCVPAFDTYFVKSMRVLAGKNASAFGNFSVRSLSLLSDFYRLHQNEIDRQASSVTTRDFVNGAATGHTYTRAKIIDICGFQYSWGR